MDKETNNNTTTTNHPQQSIRDKDDQSPRKPLAGGVGDRLKRDEWSEGAVSSLLEAYETKWALRNRAKLKGHDWEDVASHVSSRADRTKSSKTQTQCKNKIESMKKRYRSESASADASSWPLYPRLHRLLRGNGTPPAPAPAPIVANDSNNSYNLLAVEAAPVAAAPPPPPPPQPVDAAAQNSHGSNGVDRVAKQQDGAANKNTLSDHASDKNNASMEITSDSSTPALYSDAAADKSRSRRANKVAAAAEKKAKRKKRKSDNREADVAESIRWLAEAVVKSEQARAEAMRDVERMRAEAEAKRAEVDLRRTEIIANTQLEIARIFAGVGGDSNKAVDSSLRIGRN